LNTHFPNFAWKLRAMTSRVGLALWNGVVQLVRWGIDADA